MTSCEGNATGAPLGTGMVSMPWPSRRSTPMARDGGLLRVWPVLAAGAPLKARGACAILPEDAASNDGGILALTADRGDLYHRRGQTLRIPYTYSHAGVGGARTDRTHTHGRE